jgi:DNA-binding NarL/FixJ family response regulator
MVHTAYIGDVFHVGEAARGVPAVLKRSLEYATVVLRVLVVDDHPAILRHVSTWVHSSQVAEVIDTESDPTAVLAKWEALRPDVTLCDVHMPGLDGIELCAQLRARFPTAAVLLFSARDDAALRSKARVAGAAGVISKTASPHELAAALTGAATQPA